MRNWQLNIACLALGVSIEFDPVKLPDEIREYFRNQGRIGAKKRAASLSPEDRQRIARKAANARWASDKAEKKRALKKF